MTDIMKTPDTSTETSADITEDVEAIARAVIAGRSLKRGVNIQLVKDLLAMFENERVAKLELAELLRRPLVPMPSPSAVCNGGLPQGVECTTVTLHAPRHAIAASPITVHVTDTGAMFLGREANRHYTPKEAMRLAQEIEAKFPNR